MRLAAVRRRLRMDGQRGDGRATRSRLRRGHAPARPVRAGQFVRQHRGPRLAVRRPAYGMTPSAALRSLTAAYRTTPVGTGKRTQFSIMWVIEDHRALRTHIMPDHAGDRGAVP